MKRNKLYTVNKWNQPAFGKNLFDLGGVQTSGLGNTNFVSSLPSVGGGLDFNAGKALGSAMSAGSSGRAGLLGGLSGGLGSSLGSIGGGAISGIGSMVGGAIGSAIGGGYESGVGNALGSLGKVASVIPGPWGAAISGGLQVLGGGINALWGTKVDEAKLKANQEGTNTLLNFASNASSLDDVKGITASSNVQDAYSGGVFKKDWAERKNAEIRKLRNDALAFADRSVGNNIFNLTNDQMNNALANYSAYGGPVDTVDNNMGAIDYDFMDRYMTAKERQNELKNKVSNTPSMPVFMQNGFAFGGDLQTNGADFPTKLTHINAGGSHSENPNDGVQMGVDPEGTPNLVEENETVFNNYVYSNRIFADGGTLQKFHLPKKAKLTFADISKKLEKEIKERPNDPISEAGFKAQMEQLADEQERQKQEMEAERAKAAFEALSPEEQTALMQQKAQQEAMAQQAAQEQAMVEQQAAMQQATPEELAMAQQAQMQADGTQAMVGQEAPMMAEGGHLFPWGGLKELFAVKPPYTASRTTGYIPYIQDDKDKYFDESAVKARELEDDFKAWTQYVNDNWDTEEVQSYLKNLDAAAGGNHLFDKDGNIVAGDKAKGILSAKDYFNHARTKDHKWGYYHLTPTLIKELTEVNPDVPIPSGRRPQPATMTTNASGLKPDDSAIRKDVKPAAAAYEEAKTPEQKAAKEESGIVPRRRWEGLRYAGLFGPAVGLGMQALGIGRPDTSGIDAAVNAANGPITEANYQPIGNYLTYRPMDIWYQQNALNAQSRATDRALLNNSSPSRAAGVLANGYNSQLASGNLYRQALEYNDALEKQVAEFNRGTDMFNAEAYNKNSQFNADARNRARQYGAQMALQGASQKMDADAGWYNGLYGNVAGLFKGLGDIGRENAQWNMVSDMWADGLAGTATEKTNSARGHLKRENKSKGGKLNKKRGLTI